MSIDHFIDSLVPPPAKGRRPVYGEVVRELNEADIQTLWTAPEGGLESSTPAILRIKNSHHMLARLLAEGRKDVECSQITGYSPNRISILKRDPAFKELLEYYKSQVSEAFVNVHERLATVGLAAVEELHERLEEAPQGFANRELMELAELGLDRAGFGPKSTTNVNVGVALVSSDKLAELKAEAARRTNGTILTLTQDDRRTGVGGTVIDGAVVADDSPQGQQSTGDQISESPGEGTALPVAGDSGGAVD